MDLHEIWKLNDNEGVAIRIDNKAVVDVARSGSTKGLSWLATKPFSIRAGCLHDLVELKVLIAEFIGTEGQLADLNTKALARVKLAVIIRKLNLFDPSESGERTDHLDPPGPTGAVSKKASTNMGLCAAYSCLL